MIWSLQVLRFVAALMVVYVHAGQLAFGITGSSGFFPPEFQLAGQAGVDIFFVLSGVIIYKTGAHLHWLDFAWKRARRILPFYLLVTVVALIASLRAGAPLEWRDYLATFTLWPATDIITTPVVGVAWTLCFEALFYFAFALALIDRRWIAGFAVAFLTSLVLRPQGAVFEFLGNPIIFEFLLGVAIARLPALSLARWLVLPGFAIIFSVGFFGLAPIGNAADFLRGEGGFLRVLVYGFPAAAIVYGFMQMNGQRSFWTEQGDASYVLYLSHGLLMPALAVPLALLTASPDLIIAASCIVTTLFAWRLHILVEVPLLKLLPRNRKSEVKSLAGIPI
jgi:exopolysaccharide production protein ExoZ